MNKASKLTVEIIAALLIALWVYAGVSKLVDYSTFKIQLGKSPLLTHFPGLVAIAVPLFELLLSIALLYKRARKVGFYGSLFLLIGFSTYLIAILSFSYYIPCSCGGILTGMSWKAHIVFNLSFAVLTIVAIVLSGKRRQGATYDYAV